MTFRYIFIILLFSSFDTLAQGNLSGSFETNSIYYQNDKKSGAETPENNLGSNNYLKLDYQYKKFRGGIQYEAYLPVLQGLPTPLHGSDLVFKYVSFHDSSFAVTVGDFYEQFGAGLIFRAYEERTVGLNTAVEGVNLAYSIKDKIIIKGIVGKPREFMNKAESTLKGATISANLGELLNFNQASAGIELSVLNRYQAYSGQDIINPNVNAISVKGNWASGGFTFQGEYAYKTPDKSTYSNNLYKDGSALQIELGYNSKGFGSLFTFRRLEYMQFGTTRGISGIGRDLNYLPALTRQHTFSLATLNPHNTMGNDEIGGQVDLHYKAKRGSTLGGKYGTRLIFNASTYSSLKGNAINGFEFLTRGSTHYYQDINFELDKRLNRALSFHFLYSGQLFNPIVIGKASTLYASQIVATDLTLNTSSIGAFRFEAQHLWSKDFQKNWAASQIEYSPNPDLTFFINTMYNYGDTNINYYKVGSSYNVSRTRFALNYGRNREGIVCAGGVCLYMPAFTGLNLSIISSF